MTASGSFAPPAVEVLPAASAARLRDRLAGPARPARILHRGRHALYLDLDGWCLGVVSSRASAVPCALRLARPDLGRLAESTQAVVAAGILSLYDGSGGRCDVRVARLVDVRVPRLPIAPPAEVVARLRKHTAAAVEELGDQAVVDEEALLGRGSGLTPLGDDVLAGWAATSYALGLPTPARADPRQRTTLFSATLLDCAHRGEVLPEFAALVGALRSGDVVAVDRAAATLAAVGHTSGAGLLLGAVRRLESHPTEGKPLP